MIAIVGTTPHLNNKEDMIRLEKITEFHVKVQEQLRKEANDPHGLLSQEYEGDEVTALSSLLRKITGQPVSDNAGGFIYVGTVVPGVGETVLLRQELETIGVHHPKDLDLLVCYHYTLLTRRHNKYLPVRTVKQAYIVSYNPWILLASKANGECEIITHTLSSVFRYITKGTQSSTLLDNAKELENRRTNKREEDMARTLESAFKKGRRVVCLGEAYRLLDPRMAIASTSGAAVVFVSCSLVDVPSPARILRSQEQSRVLDYIARFSYISVGIDICETTIFAGPNV